MIFFFFSISRDGMKTTAAKVATFYFSFFSTKEKLFIRSWYFFPHLVLLLLCFSQVIDFTAQVIDGQPKFKSEIQIRNDWLILLNVTFII